MRRRLLHGSGVTLLALCVALVVWQGSFSFGSWGPTSPEQTVLLWTASSLVVVLTITLAFMLTRTAVKLYVERHSNREGSRIKTKLVLGALALTVLPVCFLVFFSIEIMNRNLEKWFNLPADNIRANLGDLSRTLDGEMRGKARAQALWLASLPEVESVALGLPVPGALRDMCHQQEVDRAHVRLGNGRLVQVCDSEPTAEESASHVVSSTTSLGSALLTVDSRIPIDIAQRQDELQKNLHYYNQLRADYKKLRSFYIGFLLLITLFILFVATWVALFLARQISVPISALLAAYREVRGGNLGHRVQVRAIDELATLVRAFNDMTQDLESNAKELERRRRFTEAILESIPTGVLSLSGDGYILRSNRAARGILGEAAVARATRLNDLLSPDDTAEIRYLMNRARRTRSAATRLELKSAAGRTVNVSATVSALDDQTNSGFVLVLEDTTELLKAQKAEAWHEVARRVAHEIKNPLTPIALCAERILRQVGRIPLPAESKRVLAECAQTIDDQVVSLKTLVDEFSQYARWPAAHPVPADLNEAVEAALAVFQGRLDGIEVVRDLAPALPPVALDREQFSRALVNLVDNAAEAMSGSLVRRLYLGTRLLSPETVEVEIADTGCGISAADKERLFLPYFSTKQRGTGLGLAIVSHILGEHKAEIRVEDNRPAGARFIIEMPTVAVTEPDRAPLEASA